LQASKRIFASFGYDIASALTHAIAHVPVYAKVMQLGLNVQNQDGCGTAAFRSHFKDGGR